MGVAASPDRVNMHGLGGSPPLKVVGEIKR